VPCGDQTEFLYLRLDESDRLAEYRLTKRSCGRPVGDPSLLVGRLRGKTYAQLRADGPAGAREPASSDAAEDFLREKHFRAVLSGFAVLSGDESGRASDPIRVVRVYAEGGGVALEAELSVVLPAGRIDPCSRSCR